ncbi:efflux transporter outer membrane subunit [Mitsuaria sp. GD03876]|jgi:multidrug efflux system outer membrane protein|uniref:efflux transporter outer membrane subunit n=1 Tax=Mitsuaria sp. GD03876 TaxID=2975399 RepID=UPI0024497396|nr:efflux transporter outer membrane subunit [Mitsuaria sp. GD03876]MDH0865629.1 efflux transporter outer membrane subunit [Mitsuaria sp. GD03876]
MQVLTPSVPSRAAITALLTSLLAGCATSPPATPPALSVPPAWAFDVRGGAQATPLATAEWWRDFGNQELNELVETALRANLDVRMAAARVEQARALVDIADADRVPQLGLEAGMRSGRESGADPKARVARGGFRASWELDLFGDKRMASLAAEKDLESAELARQSVRVVIAAEVMTAYFDAQSSTQREAIAREVAATLERQIEVAQRRFQAGQVSRLDVDRLTAELGQERANAAQLRGAREVRLRQMAVLLGASQAPLGLRFPPIPDSAAAMPAVLLPIELLERRPDVRGPARAVEAAVARLGIAKRDLYPRISLDWAGSRERQSVAGAGASPTTVVGYGVALSLPIFDGGRIRANIEIHEAKAQEAMLSYEKAMLSALADAEAAAVQLEAAQAGVSALSRTQTAGADAASRSQRLFDSGLVDLNTVLDARRIYLKARDGMLQGQGAQWAAAVAVRRAFAGRI